MNPNLSQGARQFLEQAIRAGGIVSDGPMPDHWIQGWSVHPFLDGKAHWWIRSNQRFLEGAFVGSLCGLEKLETKAIPLLGAGSFEQCQRCDARLLARMKAPR